MSDMKTLCHKVVRRSRIAAGRLKCFSVSFGSCVRVCLCICTDSSALRVLLFKSFALAGCIGELEDLGDEAVQQGHHRVEVLVLKRLQRQVAESDLLPAQRGRQ